MAQLAIPLLALGGLYVIAKQSEEDSELDSKEKKKDLEGFSNYPVVPEVKENGVNDYSSSNQTTDKFFKNPVSQEKVSKETHKQLSLTGDPINNGDFKHNNMVPFYSGKSNGVSVSSELAEIRLDNMQGSGSQAFRKTEQAPLFNPQENVTHQHGAPNVSDFMQSRVNPSLRMANTKPWEEERVAPGLGKGYTTNGGVGFNSGMEKRQSWMPKNVDELRVSTNPKKSYELAGHQGPANSFVKETGSLKTHGRVEKYTPDTYYTVGPNRWNVTTGVEKAPTARGTKVMRDVNRPETSQEYYGNVRQDKKATYSNRTYQPSTRPELEPTSITNVSAVGKRTAGKNDYGRSGFVPLPTIRSTVKNENTFGGAYGVARAVVAPVMDILRPSRKENTIGNIRENGNAGTTVSKSQVHNPGDRTKTTLRETIEGAIDRNYLNYQGGNTGDYAVSEYQPVNVQRDTTSACYTPTPSMPTSSQTYNAAYEQRNNVNKTYVNRPNQGGTQMFNQQENVKVRHFDMSLNSTQRLNQGTGPSIIPCAGTSGTTNVKPNYESVTNTDRINPDLLSAFKENPYTQSLRSVA